MLPTLFEVDINGYPFGVHPYGLFILLAFCSAFIISHLRALKVGIHPDRLAKVYVSAAVGGMAGGKILHAIVVAPQETMDNPMSLFSGAGFVVYGGVLGGTLAVAATAHVVGIPKWKLADLAAPAVVIGMSVGRIGCFFAGCCHGAIAPVGANPLGLFPEGTLHGQAWLSATAPFATLEFWDGVGDIHDAPLYPTQIWDAVLLMALVVFLNGMYKYRKFDGQIAAIGLMLQPPIRIFVEAFRADPRGYAIAWEVSETVASWVPPGMKQAGGEVDVLMAGITTSQAIGFVAMAGGAAMFALRRNAGVDPEVPISEEELDELD